MPLPGLSNFVENLYFGHRFIRSLSLESKPLLVGKKVVINTIRSSSLILHQELFLANVLARCGCRVYVILDDGTFRHWDTSQIHDMPAVLNPSAGRGTRQLSLRLKCRLIRSIYATENLTYIYYSELLGDGWRKTALNENDRKNAISSARRYLECGEVVPDDPAHEAYLDLSLENCMISKAAALKILHEIKPDLFITSHGIYSLWGPAFRVMRTAGVKSLVYGANVYVPGQVIISDAIHQVLAEDTNWTSFKKEHILINNEVDRVEAYFDSRIHHKTLDTSIYYGKKGKFIDKNIKNENGYTFGLFPSIIWDGDVCERETIFNGCLEWILHTIDHFSRQNRHRLVIRFHPAEASMWSRSVKLYDVIRKHRPKFDVDSRTIVVIHGHEKIDTYEFIKNNIDVGIMYDGILSMEMSYMGIPVISCSRSRFSGEDFLCEPNNLSEYYSLLDNPDRMLKEPDYVKTTRRNSLYKYAYWYFYRSGCTFSFLNRDKYSDINYKNAVKIFSKNDNAAFLDKIIDRIVGYLENK